jgi:hypothetical protein
VVCFNPVEARRDAAVCEAIVASLRTKLKAGDRELVGNAEFRRFLATPQDGHFEIDAARITDIMEQPPLTIRITAPIQ